MRISDQESSFKALERDMTDQEAKETIEWMKGWTTSKEKLDLEKSLAPNSFSGTQSQVSSWDW